MRVYQVGGSVRDKLLGKSPRDRDFLVLDATEEELTRRGLVKVGETFPIFLDRETGDEFTLGLSLEEDLGRRDLTINAMAFDESGNLIDLFGGQEDLKKKLLRAVRRENFFKDPLRVFRTARFLSQLEGFTIEAETRSLMAEVSATKEFRDILPERLVKELRNVFATARPSRFFETMNGSLRELSGKWSLSVDRPEDEKRRFALVTEKLNEAELEKICGWLRVQNDWRDFARAWILLPQDLSAENIIEYFYAIDAFRNPGLVTDVSALSGRGEILRNYLAVKEIGIRDVDPQHRGKDIAVAIRAARLDFLKGRS